MLHFEMALEVIAMLKCPYVTINGANKFAVNGSMDSNSTNDNTNLTSRLMHQLVMSITLMKSDKKNVTLRVSHEYQLTIYGCL
jgi:hypothetical protein